MIRLRPRLAPSIVALVMIVPVAGGLAATLLPAFGYLPAIGAKSVSLAPMALLLAQPNLALSAGLSLFTGLMATLTALLLVMLFLAGFAGTRTFRRVQHLISPLLAVPHAAAAFGLAFLIAPSGLFVRLVSPELTGFERPPDWLIPQDRLGLTMMAGLIVKEIPFLFLVALAALPQLPLGPARQVMTSLGYGRIRGFMISLWVPAYRQIRLPVFAVLGYSTSVVDVAMILGPDLPAPLAVRVTEWMSDPDLDLRLLASAGALLQLGITLAAIAIWIAIERGGAGLMAFMSSSGQRKSRDGMLRAGVCVLVALSAALVFLGLGVLALWSFAGLWQFPDLFPDMLTLRTWERTWPLIGRPLWTTVWLAVFSAGLALLLTIALLWSETHGRRGPSKGLRVLLYVPLLVPQLSFVFGLQIMALSFGLDPGIALLLMAHLVFVLPYVILSLSQPWHALDPRLELVAAGLGASPMRILALIRLPIMLRACLTAFAIGFAVSIGLYLPTVLLGAGRIVTITTEAVALSSGGDRRVIGAYGLLQSALPFGGFFMASLLAQLLLRNRRAMRV